MLVVEVGWRWTVPCQGARDLSRSSAWWGCSLLQWRTFASFVLAHSYLELSNSNSCVFVFCCSNSLQKSLPHYFGWQYQTFHEKGAVSFIIGVRPPCALWHRLQFLFQKCIFSCKHLTLDHQNSDQYCLPHIPQRPSEATGQNRRCLPDVRTAGGCTVAGVTRTMCGAAWMVPSCTWPEHSAVSSFLIMETWRQSPAPEKLSLKSGHNTKAVISQLSPHAVAASHGWRCAV